ncbi:MAG: hypothetical protein H7835_19995, partial [Magnetococcus sp. XQGC-1]
GKLIRDLLPGIRKTAELVQKIYDAGMAQRTSIHAVDHAVQNLSERAKINSIDAQNLNVTANQLTDKVNQLLGATSAIMDVSGHEDL